MDSNIIVEEAGGVVGGVANAHHVPDILLLERLQVDVHVGVIWRIQNHELEPHRLHHTHGRDERVRHAAARVGRAGVPSDANEVLLPAPATFLHPSEMVPAAPMQVCAVLLAPPPPRPQHIHPAASLCEKRGTCGNRADATVSCQQRQHARLPLVKDGHINPAAAARLPFFAW